MNRFSRIKKAFVLPLVIGALFLSSACSKNAVTDDTVGKTEKKEQNDNKMTTEEYTKLEEVGCVDEPNQDIDEAKNSDEIHKDAELIFSTIKEGNGKITLW